MWVQHPAQDQRPYAMSKTWAAGRARRITLDGHARSALVVSTRSPAEVSFYLGLATANATFSAAAVALGLLHCTSWRARAFAVTVLLSGTLGIASALATVARGRSSGVGNILIGFGVAVAAACVLLQALRLIFTVRQAPRSSKRLAARTSSTLPLPITWTKRRADPDRFDTEGPPAGAPRLIVGSSPARILRRPLFATIGGFIAVLASAAMLTLPDLFTSVFHSRPVGVAATPLVRTAADRDGDGVSNRQDACPITPAITSDGCLVTPEHPSGHDHDGDGILDPQDACASLPAKTLGGCPKTRADRDGDGIRNRRDECPLTSAVTLTGCPPSEDPAADTHP